MLIVTVALVLAGIVLLIFSYVDNSLGLIYLALTSVGLAALTLIGVALSSRKTAGRRSVVATAGSAVLGESGTVDREPLPGSVISAKRPNRRSHGGLHSAGFSGETALVPDIAAVPGIDVGRTGMDVTHTGLDLTSAEVTDANTGVVAGDMDAAAGISAAIPVDADYRYGVARIDPPGGTESDWDHEPVFPIEDYDELGVAEIFPLIGELEPDELIEVRTHELANKARGTVLRRIEGRLAEAGFDLHGSAQQNGLPSLERSASSDVIASMPAPVEPLSAAEPSSVDDGVAVATTDPLPGYSSMRAGQILPLLASLSPDQLALVAAAERSGARRSTILTRIARLEAAASRGGGTGHPVFVPGNVEGGPVPARVGRLTAKKPVSRPARPDGGEPATGGGDVDGLPSDPERIPRT